MEPTDQDTAASPPKRDRYVYERKETGTYVFAEENTWAAHRQRIRIPEVEIGFNAQRFGYFDGIIAGKLGLKALTDEKNPDFPKYRALRENIAVLRNFILTHYEDKGLFDGDIDPQMERIRSIAETIGQALANDKGLNRALTKFASVDVANIDGVGACELYKHLLEVQEHPTAPDGVVKMFQDLKSYFLIPNRDWKLPELEESPFSPQNLAAPPPGYVPAPQAKPESSDSDANDVQARTQEDTVSIKEVEDIVKHAKSLYSVDQMAEAPREDAVEEARKILRNLRNMQFTDRPLEEFLGQGSPVVAAAKQQALTQLAVIFTQQYKQAVARRPSLRSDPVAEQARDTVATIALELTEHTRRVLLAEETRIDEQERRQLEAQLVTLIDSLPPECELRVAQPTERILDTLEMGLQHVSGQEIDTPMLERLALASHRAHLAAMDLHNERLEEHHRAESLEHARDLLGKLKEMVPPDQTLGEFAQSATIEEKVQFAKHVEELSETYRNIVAEATSSNPELSADAAIREASDAVGGFASAVKLMATKEIPNSIAAAQQISADITQEPGKWGDLHHRAVDRLVKSAEGGLEKAIGEIASDEEEQDTEVAQEAIETALMHADTSKRKKRRRGESKPRSGKTAKKQRKKSADITADDRILKQGIYAEDRQRGAGTDVAAALAAAKEKEKDKDKDKSVRDMSADDRILGKGAFADERAQQNREQVRPPRNNQNRQNRQNRNSLQGLSAQDLATIQQVGGSLRNLNNQATPGSGNTTPQQNDPNRDPNRRGGGGPKF